MEKMKASTWQYAPPNSPQPLPRTSFLLSGPDLIPVEMANFEGEAISIDELKQLCLESTADDEPIAKIFLNNGNTKFSSRKPVLLLGELANPFQLSRLNLGIIPVLTVRIRNVCKTYADSLDSRMITPGIHHITLARTQGWWEGTHLAFATIEQIKKMIDWLSNGRQGAWRPVKPAEGEIMLEYDSLLNPPSKESIVWDGKTELCNAVEPPSTGPSFNISEVIVPVHTRYGCYDSRGKLIRHAHIVQRDFHSNYFRRGSSMKWQDILDVI